MIRSIITLLLFVALKFAMHCEENASTTEGPLKQILYEVSSSFEGNLLIKFPWPICGDTVPTSKYLPIRAGTSTGSTRFEVATLTIYGVIRGKDISTYKISNYKMLFYVYVSGLNTLFKLYVEVEYTNKISIQLNRQIKSINVTEDSRCVKKSKNKCLFQIDKLKSKYKKNDLSILMLNGWNQVGFVDIAWEELYLLHIYNTSSIKHRSFIPWNTTLPNTCAMRDQYVAQNLNKIKYFELDMDFTYGQRDGLNTVLSCFREIASENNVTIGIKARYTKKYKIAKFELSGKRRAKNKFYKLLAKRKLDMCIENTCIHWIMVVAEKTNAPELTDASDSILTSAPVSIKTILKNKIKKAVSSIRKLLNRLKKIKFKDSDFATKTPEEKVKKVATRVEKAINRFQKKKNSTPHSRLNTERANSSMQKSIVYIVLIAATVLLLIAAGVFAFKTQQGKLQKDLCTDQSVLRKWTNEN